MKRLFQIVFVLISVLLLFLVSRLYSFYKEINMIKNSEYPNSAVEFNLKETQYALDMSIYVPASCSFVDVKSMWAATFVCTESNDVIMEKENEILEQYYEKIIINEKIYYYDFEKKYKISEIEVKKGKFINYLIFVFTRV